MSANDYAERVEQHREQVPEGCEEAYEGLLADGCAPHRAVAALEYAAALLTNQKITQDEVSEEFDVSVTSIRKWYQHAFEQHDAGINPPDDVDLATYDGGTLEEKSTRKLESEFFEAAGLDPADYGYDPDVLEVNHASLIDYFGVEDKAELIEALEASDLTLGEDYTLFVSVNKSGVIELLKDAREG